MCIGTLPGSSLVPVRCSALSHHAIDGDNFQRNRILFGYPYLRPPAPPAPPAVCSTLAVYLVDGLTTTGTARNDGLLFNCFWIFIYCFWTFMNHRASGERRDGLWTPQTTVYGFWIGLTTWQRSRTLEGRVQNFPKTVWGLVRGVGGLILNTEF